MGNGRFYLIDKTDSKYKIILNRKVCPLGNEWNQGHTFSFRDEDGRVTHVKYILRRDGWYWLDLRTIRYLKRHEVSFRKKKTGVIE